MLPRFAIVSALLLFAVTCQSAVARAQWDGTGGKVSGTGTITIKRRPDILRMQVQLAGHGKDIKDALAKIKARRDAVQAKLVELGATKDSLEAGEPRTSQEDNTRQRQMEMMVRERMRQQGRKMPKKEESKPVNLTLTIKAEWPLKAGDAEQAFLTAYDIQQKVTAELAKLNSAEEASAEDEEMAEEMMTQGMNYEDGRPKPGEPSFVYAARIPKEELEKALTSAFAKAKEQAQQLSRVAGSKLGALERVATHESSVGVEDQFNYGGYRGNPFMYQALMRQQQNQPKTGDGPLEALGVDAAEVTLSVTVVASFDLAE